MPMGIYHKKALGATGGGEFMCNIPVDGDLCALLIRHLAVRCIRYYCESKGR